LVIGASEGLLWGLSADWPLAYKRRRISGCRGEKRQPEICLRSQASWPWNAVCSESIFSSRVKGRGFHVEGRGYHVEGRGYHVEGRG